MQDIRIYVEQEDAEETYKNIRLNGFTKNYFKETYEIFIMSLLIGKYILNKKEPLKNPIKGFIRIETLEKKDAFDIMKCIAIEETKDVNVLSDIKSIFQICEEYANSGIKELKKWTVNEETFQTKLAENLLEFYEKNSPIINKYNE